VDLGSVSRANNDEALKALRRKLPTSRYLNFICLCRRINVYFNRIDGFNSNKGTCLNKSAAQDLCRNAVKNKEIARTTLQEIAYESIYNRKDF